MKRFKRLPRRLWVKTLNDVLRAEGVEKDSGMYLQVVRYKRGFKTKKEANEWLKTQLPLFHTGVSLMEERE